MMRYASVFWTLFEREWYVYRHRAVTILTSWLLIQTISFSFVQGYLKPLMYFGFPMDRRALMVFAGAVGAMLIRRSFDNGMNYFRDLHEQKHIWYQRIAAPHSAVYFSRVAFATLFVWFMIVAMIPIAKLVLRGYLSLDHASAGLYVFITFSSSLLMTTYAFMCLSFASQMRDITTIRVRINEVLMWMGAFSATWTAMYASGPIWGVLALLSPMTYMCEALRWAFYPGPDLLPFWFAVGMIYTWITVFSVVGYTVFTRKVAH